MFDGRNGIERHGVAVAVANKKLANVLRVRPVIAFSLYIYLPCSPEPIEVVDEKSAHECLQRLINLGQVDSLLQHFVAIDVDEDLRNIRQKGGDQPGELGPFARGVEKRLQILGKETDVFARAILEYERESTSRADTGNCRWRKRERETFAQTREVFVQSRLDRLILFLGFRSLTPRLESDEEKGAVSVLRETEQTEADDACRVLHAWSFAQEIFNFAASLIGTLKRRRVRQLQCKKNVALVFFR